MFPQLGWLIVLYRSDSLTCAVLVKCFFFLLFSLILRICCTGALLPCPLLKALYFLSHVLKICLPNQQAKSTKLINDHRLLAGLTWFLQVILAHGLSAEGQRNREQTVQFMILWNLWWFISIRKLQTCSSHYFIQKCQSVCLHAS